MVNEAVTRKVCAAEDCNKAFEATHPRKRYCSPRCAGRVKRRRIMKQRILEGLCPHCGGEYDNPISFHRNKTSTVYCSKCRAYYQKAYKQKAGKK